MSVADSHPSLHSLLRRVMADIEFLLRNGRHNDLSEARKIRGDFGDHLIPHTFQTQLVDELRRLVHDVYAGDVIAQSSAITTVPITDALGRLFFRIEQVVSPRLAVMFDTRLIQESPNDAQTLDGKLRTICAQLIHSNRVELDREARVVLEYGRPSTRVPFIRLLSTGAAPLGDDCPTMRQAREFVRTNTEAWRIHSIESFVAEARRAIEWRRRSSAFSALCIALAGVLPCGESLMEIFHADVDNIGVPRILLHKAIGVLFRRPLLPAKRRRRHR